MERDQYYKSIQAIFNEMFDDEDIQVTPDLTASHVNGWDSFKHIELLVAIQNRFHVKFTAREIEKLACVGDIVNLIYEKKK